jgi:hypothetical protein
MSQELKCSAGHASSESDFCSVCGVEMAPAAGASPVVTSGANSGGSSGASGAASAPADKVAHKGEDCPKCQAEREDPSSPFCGTCGYNFVTRVGGDVSQASPVAAPAASAPGVIPFIPVGHGGSPVPASAVSSGARMDVVVSVDFAKPGAPRVRSSLTFPLYDEESLIGRKNSAIKQTVSIEDEAISKRHALIVRLTGKDAGYVIRDINSTNGTKLNGVLLTAGEDNPLKEGDVITLGEFSVITVQTIRLA